MTKLVLQARPAAFGNYFKIWATTVPVFRARHFARPVEKTLPLATTFEIKYHTLLSKIDKLRSVEVKGEDHEYAVTETAASAAKEVVNELLELNILEKNIAAHLLSNMNGGIQIELDGQHVKADIEILENGKIVLTTYRGAQNAAEEYELTTDSLYLINEYLNINDFFYA